MNFDFFSKLNTVKKADPDAVRKKLIRSRDFNINLKTVAVVFAALIVILGAVSAIIVISEKRSSVLSTSVNDATATTLSKEEFIQNAKADISGNYLFALTKEDNKDLKLIALINISHETKRLKMTVVPVNAVCTVNNVEATMAEHLQSGGITQLLWAVGEFSKISIEKYMYCDEQNFIDFMKVLGNIEFNIPSQVSHEYNGINFIIEEGNQLLTPDMMLKYFLYVCENVYSNPEDLKTVFSVLGNKLLNVEDYTQIEKNYNSIINCITTNISPIDISYVLPDIVSIISSDGLNNIEITSDIEQFR